MARARKKKQKKMESTNVSAHVEEMEVDEVKGKVRHKKFFGARADVKMDGKG